MSQAGPGRPNVEAHASSVGAPPLRFTRLTAAATVPTRARPGDAGLDVHAVAAATIAPGERTAVPTGLALAIPDGYAGLVLPRSGLAARHGITLVNAPGLIDPGYRGEVQVLLLNTDADHAYEVRPGDRIAQLLLVAFAVPDLVETAELDPSARGDGGFGSSGR